MGVFVEITRTILKEMKKGNLVWRKPWRAGLHKSAVTKRPYSGVNQLLLAVKALEKRFTTSLWATFDGIKKLGGAVKRGEKGTQVVFFKSELLVVGLEEGFRERFPELQEILEKRKGVRERTFKKILSELGIEMEDVESGLVKKEVPVLRTYYVFNLDQAEGVEVSPESPAPGVTDEKLSRIISLPQVKPHPTHAFYVPGEDVIYIPSPSQFESRGAWYETFFHELIHWTAKRLGRKSGIRGSEEYACEELAAELGSAFLAAELGVEVNFSNSAAYLQSWVDAMEKDPRYIFRAARDAMRAVRWILRQVEVREEVAA